MKRLLIAAAAASALALSACETATPYQPLGANHQSSGGFSEQRIEPNRWRVTFAGNSLTSRETVETYLLYRSAELTLAQGFDWFALADRHTDRDTRVYADPIGPGFYGPGWGYWGPSWRYYRRGAWGGWGGWGGGWGPGTFDIQQVTKYEATAEIVMGRGPKPEGDRRAFDARAVMDNLRGKIVRPSA